MYKTEEKYRTIRCDSELQLDLTVGSKFVTIACMYLLWFFS